MSENKFQHIRDIEFKRLGDQVYFDHTGSCLYTDSHIKRYSEQLTKNVFGNPHSGNACSEKMSDIIHQTRLDVLRRFNVTVDDYDVIFTSGATDSLKIIGENFNWTPGSVYAYTEDNHTSVVGIRELAAERGASAYCVSCAKALLSGCTIVKAPQNLLKSKSSNENPLSLFAFPAQSNFSGAKYPLTWIKDVKRNLLPLDLIHPSRKCNWYVLCDAASFVSTSALDLKEYPADFVTISFYKMFGFPTGLGALLVRKNSEETLCNKKFFGGGSVSGWLASRDFHSPKPVLHDRFEDGSSSFLSILALKLGFDTFNQLGLTIDAIEKHTHDLWRNLYYSMKTLAHENGMPLVEIYLNQDDSTINCTSQGPILAFNIKRSDGSYVGYNHVVQLANSNSIYLRGGCFCNLGACVSLIGTEINVLLEAYGNGHVCGDAIDLIEGEPIGAVRMSLGPHSTAGDVNTFIEFLTDCFREESCVYSSQYSADPDKSTKIILDDILLYPVKSCQGMSVKKWEICDTGLKYDRMWMVVDEYGSPITLKKAPHLTSIRPTVDVTKQCLTLRADDMDSIAVPFIQNLKEAVVRDLNVNAKCVSKVCGDTVVGYDCGESVALWLSQILNVSCSLVQKCFDSQRYTSKRFNAYGNPNKISLVNEAQLLLVNRSSIEYLCRRMIEHGYLDESDTMLDNMAKRFRANLVVSGASSFSEDKWNRISFNATNIGGKNGRVDMVKCGLCQRCNVICIDPDTGQKLNGPLRALANVSLSDNAVRRKPTFGIYLKCDQSSCVLTAKSEVTIEDIT